MKLKIKLAYEYNDSLLERFVSVTSNQKAYLAGFEQAREMAIEKMADTPYARFRLRELGEEEVQE